MREEKVLGRTVEAMKRLARAIEQFREIYERVEGEKQKQMIELQKQRMQFTKDLEVLRMQLFMDAQVQLKKIKQAKRTVSDDDVYSQPPPNFPILEENVIFAFDDVLT